MVKPLAGMRVLDLADEKGELCGRLLADLGADVIRVEPPEGAVSRGLAPFTPGGEASLYFAVRNAGKRGAVADEYLEALLELWTKDTASFRGRFVRFENVETGPRPLTDPHPPIWVGGGSDAALRRAVRFGDAWHPIRIRVPWLEKKKGELQKVADSMGRPAPQLSPRILLRLTETPETDSRRAGEGTLDQIRRDFSDLEGLGCTHVLLDFFTGDVEATRRSEPYFRVLETLAGKVLDLPRRTLR